jgi:hypothetical protein
MASSSFAAQRGNVTYKNPRQQTEHYIHRISVWNAISMELWKGKLYSCNYGMEDYINAYN